MWFSGKGIRLHYEVPVSRYALFLEAFLLRLECVCANLRATFASSEDGRENCSLQGMPRGTVSSVPLPMKFEWRVRPWASTMLLSSKPYKGKVF